VVWVVSCSLTEPGSISVRPLCVDEVRLFAAFRRCGRPDLALSVHSWPVTDPRENGRPHARLPDRDRDPTALVSVPDNSVRFDDVVERVNRTHDR